MGGEPNTTFDLEHLDAEAELQLLKEIRDNSQSSQVNVAISNKVTEPRIVADFPTKGYNRLVLPRIPTGGAIATSAVAIQVLVENANRYGGTVVNSGENAVVLTLSDATQSEGAALAQIWLSPLGGSWDMRLGNMLWCGSVSAVTDPEAEGEESLLRVVEV